MVTARGVNLDPLFSPDGTQLVYQRTDVENSLDLYVGGGARRPPTPVRLSDSMPAGLNKRRPGGADAGALSEPPRQDSRCRRR